MSENAYIHAENLFFSYRDTAPDGSIQGKEVLRGVTLDIQKG